MASSLSSSEDYGSDSDDEMIACQICFSRFNQENHTPKFLDCHHYFCFTCIRALVKAKIISCPTCRGITNMVGRQNEELSTNNLVLRLLNIKIDRARATNELIMSQSAAVVAAKKKQWCVTCSVIANPRCKAQKHMLCCFSEVLSKDLTLIKGRAGKCSELWNDAIEERNRAHNVYSEILGSLQCLEKELIIRKELNEKHIGIMEKKKQMSADEADFLTQTEMVPRADKNSEKSTMANIKSTVAQLDELEANHSRFKAHHLLQNLKTVEENLVHLNFSSLRPDKKPLRNIELLKKLQLSFSGERYANIPSVKASVSALSFVMLKLAEDQSKNGARRSNNSPLPQEEPSAEIVRGKNPVVGVPIEGNAVKPTKKKSAIEQPRMTFRDTLIFAPPKTSAQISRVTSPVPVTGNKCFLIFSIDGKLQSRVVVQLEPLIAPIMSGKFKEMCISNTGYQNSRIFKAYRDQYVMGGSRWFHLSTGETLPIDRKDLFKPDRSEIKKTRGSVCFQVKDSVNGVSVVSTEFQILLADQPSYRKTSTVFGQVIEGLEVCDNLSQINVVSRTQDRKVMIAECGVC